MIANACRFGPERSKSIHTELFTRVTRCVDSSKRYRNLPPFLQATRVTVANSEPAVHNGCEFVAHRLHACSRGRRRQSRALRRSYKYYAYEQDGSMKGRRAART